MLWQKEAKIPTLEELRSKINLQKTKKTTTTKITKHIAISLS